MKKLVGGLLLILMTTSVAANEIYINQIGDDLDLDITQTGDNNRIGSAAAGDMVLNGADMTFDITQTGDTNTIDATIKGNNYTGTWVFTGDRNTVDLLCSSAASANCDTVTLDITTTGSDNDYTFEIGETAGADSSIIDFTVTGDGNVIDVTLDGESADITVVLDDGASGLTNTAGNTNDLTIISSGDGTTGNVVDLDITGSGGTYNVTQTGTLIDQEVTATFDGDDANVDITQSE